jgi:hypothetical protein
VKRSITFIDRESLTVPPLSFAEKRWVTELASVLAKCPERLELLTGGDADLSVIDRASARLSDLDDGAASRDGIVLAIVPSPVVHGVSV